MVPWSVGGGEIPWVWFLGWKYVWWCLWWVGGGVAIGLEMTDGVGGWFMGWGSTCSIYGGVAGLLGVF